MTLLFKCYLHVFSEVDYIVVKTLVWLYPLIRTPYESCTSAPCRACSLKQGPLQQGGEDWVFRNSRILSFVPILEGRHPWLAQRASQAEAAIRRYCNQTCCVSSEDELKIWPSQSWPGIHHSWPGWAGASSASPLASGSCSLSCAPGVFIIDLPKHNYLQLRPFLVVNLGLHVMGWS